MKRGQVTIFVVVGIIVVVLILLVVYFRVEITDFKKETFQSEKLITEEEAIRVLVQECVKKVTDIGVFIAQKQSGNLYLRTEGVEFNSYTVPFVYDKGKVNIISIEQFQKDFNDYISQNIPHCIKSKASFEKIEARTILDEELTIQVSYPFTIIIEGGSIRNDQGYEYINKVPIKEFLKIVKEVADETKENPEAIHLAPLITQEIFDSSTILKQEKTIYVLKDFLRGDDYYFSTRRSS